MIDIGKEKIKINCPDCNRLLTVTLKQVANQTTISCTGCGNRVKLVDDKGSTRKGVTEINRSFQKLERTLKIFGK